MMQFLKWFIVILIMAVCAICLNHNSLTRWIISNRVKFITDIEVTMDSARIDLKRTALIVEGFKVHNPPTYQDPIAAIVPFLYIDIDLSKLLDFEVELTQVGVYLKELRIIKNKDGQINIRDIPRIRRERREAILAAGGKSVIKEVHFQTVDLQMDTVEFYDYTREPVFIKLYPLNLNERYEDISEVSTVTSLIVFKGVTKTAVQSLINLDLYNIKLGLTRVLGNAQSLIPGAVKGAGQFFKKTSEGLTGVLEWAK